MAVSLEDAKLYLKVDSDITEDDALIEGLIEAASGYIEQCTGKYNNDDALYDLCTKMLVAHWYENRATFYPKPGNLSELPHAITAMIHHISLAAHYPALTDEAEGDAHD